MLLASSIAAFSGSCNIWEQLGKGPSNLELTHFASSPNFNQEKQVFENRIPDVLCEMN